MTYQEWINNQECLIACYWGSEQVDLMSAITVYAIAKCEGIQIDRAMYALFPDYYYNLHFAHTEEARLPSDIIKERFEGCKQILVLRKGVVRGKG